MATINGIEAVTLVTSAGPATVNGIRGVIEATAGDGLPGTVNGISRLLFVNASETRASINGVPTAVRLDTASGYGTANGVKQVVVVATDGTTIIPSGPASTLQIEILQRDGALIIQRDGAQVIAR